MGELRTKIIEFLDEPSTLFGRLVVVILLALIYLSVAQLVIEVRFPEFATNHAATLKALQYGVLAVFTVELALRLICESKRWQYLKSFYGVVDVPAVAPGLLGIVIPIPNDSAWIRTLRILRFGRALKFLRAGGMGMVRPLHFLAAMS